MDNFKRFSGGNSRGGGGGGRFNKGGFGGGNRRDGGRPEMFKATCADCGNPCEVPFRPTGERPVYCNNCFGGNRGGAPHGGPERRDFAPRAPHPPAGDMRIDDLKRQMESVQAKLDKVLNMVETFTRKHQEKEALAAQKPMATPEFFKALEKIESGIESKKKSASKKAGSKKKK